MTELPEALPVPPSADELRERSLELLEFPRVREALAEHTRTPMSRERALGLTPAHDGEVVAQLQQETAEAALVLEGGAADLTLSQDPRPLLRRSAMQGVLAGDELIAVADALDLARRAKALGGSERGRTPLLRALARNIADFRPLEREIRAKVMPLGEVKDDASPMLRQLRRESRDAYQAATGGMQAVIESDAASEALQDRLFTMRSDRLVVPIKADFKGRIPGIVHAVSDSGATLFIEPLTNVPRTNRWREAEAAEREEELRVLRALSASVSRRAGEALRALEIAGRLDAALAKARYARSYEGVTLAEHAENVELVGARHPLLAGAVPVSLALRPPQSVLVVTGPNTGGKTVALKTLGLLALMRQSGMMLPCEPSTRLPLFDAVYADIGDQQSIERAVSTFSSHVTAIIGVLEHATPRSLVLLDELGASTDPEEGSALAKAVVGRLAELGRAHGGDDASPVAGGGSGRGRAGGECERRTAPDHAASDVQADDGASGPQLRDGDSVAAGARPRGRGGRRRATSIHGIARWRGCWRRCSGSATLRVRSSTRQRSSARRRPGSRRSLERRIEEFGGGAGGGGGAGAGRVAGGGEARAGRSCARRSRRRTGKRFGTLRLPRGCWSRRLTTWRRRSGLCGRSRSAAMGRLRAEGRGCGWERASRSVRWGLREWC